MIAVLCAIVALLIEPSANASSLVPRWISTFDPTSIGLSQHTSAARLLADGSFMLAGDDSSAKSIVRFDNNGTVLSKASFFPPGYVAAYQISPFGEVFITGYVNSTNYVMKYDGQTGAPAWAAPATFPSGGTIVTTLTLDNAGNAVVAWDSGTNQLVRKISGVDGSTVWTTNAVTAGGTATKAITVDWSNNVIVTAIALGGNQNFLTVKLRGSDGATQWTATYDNSSQDRPAAVVVDHSDNVYVAGTTLVTSTTNLAAVKYNGGTGAEVWRGLVPVPVYSSFGIFPPVVATVDAENSLFIGSLSTGSGFSDSAFAKFSSSGTRVWTTTYAGTRDDAVSSIAVDGFGNMFWTGSVGGFSSGTDLILGKLNGATGAITWTQTYDRTANQNDSGVVVAINGSGDALIAGQTYDFLASDDFAFVKYNGTSGARLVVTNVDGNSQYSHYPSALSLGPSNVLHAMGTANGFEWQQFDGNTGAGTGFAGGSGYVPSAIAPDALGNLYQFSTFGNDATMLKYNSFHGVVWQKTYTVGASTIEQGRAVTVDSAGDPVGSGTSFLSGSGASVITIKYNAAGTQQWVHTFNGSAANTDDTPVAVLTDANKDVFVAVTANNSGTSNDLEVIKINGATGAQIWATPVNGGAPATFHDDAAFAFTLDAAENPVIAGRFDNFSSADVAVAKLDNVTGAIVWSSRVGTATADEAHSVTVDAAGDVIVTGESNVSSFTGDIFTVKLNGSTGATLWTATYDGGFGADNGVSVSTDAFNNVVVFGTVVRDAPHWDDLAVIRYTPAGALDATVFYDTGSADTAKAMVMIGNDPVVLGSNGDRFLLIRYTDTLGIDTLTIPPAYCNVAYNAAVKALNGTPPYSWSLTNGTLPPGLSLDTSTGVITGTPGVIGTPFTPRIRVTDSTAAFVERDYRIDGFSGSEYLPVLTTANPVCGSAVLSVPASWSSYLWQPGGQTTATITPALLHPTLFGVFLTDVTGCATRGALRLDVIQPLSNVTVTTTGATTLCNAATGGTATLADTGGGTSTHQWGYRTVSGGTITNIPGKTNTSYVITASDFPGGGVYYLVARTTPFCGNVTTSNEITVTINTPSVPTALTATAISNNRIDLSWTASSGFGVHHYNIYRSPRLCPGTTFTKIGQTTGSETTFSDTTVVTGGSYAYKVTAADSGNSCETGFSNCDDAVAYGSCALPPTFAGAGSAAANGCFLRVSWAAATSNCPSFPNIVYNVYRSTSSTFTPAPANRIASCVINTTYDDDTVATGTTYYYIVRAEDSSSGNGGPCNGGNEDVNLVRKSATPTGSAVTSTIYADSFEAPNRPALNPDAYWLESAVSGTDHLSITTCRFSSSTSSYRWGNTTGCFGNYANSLVSNLTLGGNGSVSASINGIAIPAGLTNIRLRFNHLYNTESSWDGGALYYSTTGATGTFNIVNDAVTAGQPYITSGPYDRTLNIDGGHRAWTGSHTSWSQVVVNLDALAGQTVWFRWHFVSDSSGQVEGYYFDDVAITGDTIISCASPPSPVAAFTATSTNGANQLEWLNPSSGTYGGTMIRYRTDTFPSSTLDGALAVTQNGGFAQHDSYTHTGLTNGTTYYYSAFVDNGTGTWSRSRTVAARPQAVDAAVKWVYATGASAMTAPGIGSIFAVSNDRMLHSMQVGTAGGFWPAGWRPLVMNAPSQGRPSVVPMTTNQIGGASKVAFIGSQDGYVYAINANTGAELWSTQIGDMVQGSPSVALRQYGIALSNVDLIMAGTRNSTSTNGIYALNTQGGAVAWSYTGGGVYKIGVIGGQVWIDYPTRRIYFASRGFSSNANENHTLWCLSFDETTVTRLWSVPIGDIDGSVVIFNNTVYAGANNGQVYAVNANDGSVIATFATNDGPIKGFIFPASAGNLYFSTTNTVWRLVDNLAAPRTLTPAWSVTTIPSPSVAVYNGTYVFVGASDGNLYRLGQLTSPVPVITPAMLGTGTAAVGTIGYDYQNNLAYVGTASGAIYSVSLP